jgi:diguanylate cyclase (GGDEF)-like protein
VGVALGETAAWLAARGRALDRREERWAGDLARLTTLLADLAAAEDLDVAATLVARGATEVFSSPGARVELQSTEGKRATAAHGELTPVTTSISLVGAQREVGLVELHLNGRDEDSYHDGLAQLFAIQVGTTVAQLHTISELGRAVRRDALTGTGNRRHATELLGTLRTGDALLVVDLDRFKSVNDTWGHRAGDEVLHNLGTYLQACVRSSDDVARLGGDEFVVVARAAGRDVVATANRLLRGWREGSHRTTISIGVALHRADGAAEDTFDRADAALYQAKSAGRDRAVLAER